MINYKDYISVTEDFPKPGISFKDVSPLLSNGIAFKGAIDEMKKFAEPLKPDLIIGPEARGFIFGSPLAYSLGIGFAMVRKDGKLPGETIRISYGLEYGKDVLNLPRHIIKKGMKVLIVDDLVATSGTLSAVIELLKETEAELVGIACAIGLTSFDFRKLLPDIPIFTLIDYEK